MTESVGGAPNTRLSSPRQVEYLALEGGGGKGVAYLGAIRALEEVGVLPLPRDRQDRAALEEMGVLPPDPEAQSQVKGVSGASAGAFTALFLALGIGSSELAVVLGNRQKFKGLYDGPDNDRIREVHRNNFRKSSVFDNPIDKALRRRREIAAESQLGRRVRIRPIPKSQRAPRVHDFPFADGDLSVGTSAALAGAVAAGALLGAPFLGNGTAVDDIGPYVHSLLNSPARIAEDLARFSALILFVRSLGPGITGAISEWLRNYISGTLSDLANRDPAYRDLVQQITGGNRLEEYLYNMIFDRGIFPGFAVRDFLKEQVMVFLRERQESQDPAELSDMADALTFAGLEERTGTKLVVSAVNTTTHEPAYFGPQFTPEFPVVDAVAISGCVPPAFKPVLVTDCGPAVRDGFWMDGGIANNLPIHAFDERIDGKLQPGMLALRLEDLGEEPKTKLSDPLEAPVIVDEGLFALLTDHLGGLAASVMYPSEAGQIRRSAPQLHVDRLDESDQTVLLNTSGLKTLEFAPPFERSAPRIKQAFEAVTKYFHLSGSRYSAAIEDFLEELRAHNPPPAR
jgi:predicted acylesterase/phospholipase RssA